MRLAPVYGDRMHLVSFVLSVVLILVCAISAVMDFTHNEDVVATMDRFGLPARFEVVAGLVKSAAALGLLAGLFASGHHGRGFPTTLVAWCLVAYFVVAVVFHVRAHDSAKEIVPGAGLLVLSAVLAITASVG